MPSTTAYPKFVQFANGMPTLNISAARHPITIQQQTIANPPSYDQSGATGQWSDFTTALAAMDAVRGTDVVKGGQVTTQKYMTIGMWWQAGILPNMRVVTESGSTFLIQSVDDVMEMNAVLLLNCIALGANV